MNWDFADLHNVTAIKKQAPEIYKDEGIFYCTSLHNATLGSDTLQAYQHELAFADFIIFFFQSYIFFLYVYTVHYHSKVWDQ